MKPTGYSGTPLAKKLGIKNGFRVKFVNPPKNYFRLFTDFPTELTEASADLDFIHYFTTDASRLKRDIVRMKKTIKPAGSVWISWPKKTSGVKTDLDGNLVREVGLACGLVDIKVCAIDETWSALKFVIPVKDRN